MGAAVSPAIRTPAHPATAPSRIRHAPRAAGPPGLPTGHGPAPLRARGPRIPATSGPGAHATSGPSAHATSGPGAHATCGPLPAAGTRARRAFAHRVRRASAHRARRAPGTQPCSRRPPRAPRPSPPPARSGPHHRLPGPGLGARARARRARARRWPGVGGPVPSPCRRWSSGAGAVAVGRLRGTVRGATGRRRRSPAGVRDRPPRPGTRTAPGCCRGPCCPLGGWYRRRSRATVHRRTALPRRVSRPRDRLRAVVPGGVSCAARGRGCAGPGVPAG